MAQSVDSNTESNIRVSGGFLTAWGVLGIIGTLVVLAMIPVIEAALDVAESESGQEEEIDAARAATRMALTVAAVFSGIFGALALTGGIGMLQGASWGRTMGMVGAATSLLSIPFGTAIGIYVLYALTRPDAPDHFAEA